jgi:hypothetical protein
MLADAIPEAILQKGQSALICFSLRWFRLVLGEVNILRFNFQSSEIQVFKKLKKQVMVHVEGSRGSSDWESTRLNNRVVEGEAEDRVVASSSPALGTTLLF